MRQAAQVSGLDSSGRIRREIANAPTAVINGATGRIYYNRQEDQGTVHEVKHINLPGDAYPAEAAGQPFDPGSTTDTGPYRRVYTKEVPGIPEGYARSVYHPGYSEKGAVTTSCNPGKLRQDAHHGDVGYVYLGGWSPLRSVEGAAVDVGLQYSSVKNNYAPFINVGLKSYVQTDPLPQRVVCGGRVELTFLISAVMGPGCPGNPYWQPVTDSSCPTLMFTLAIKPLGRAGNNEYQSLTWVAPTGTIDGKGDLFGGWGDEFHEVGAQNKTYYGSEAPCNSCVFKWMTSIAQSKQKHQVDYADGSHFAATWSDHELSCFVTNSCRTAPFNEMEPVSQSWEYCSEYPYWYPGTYQFGQRDCRDTPTTGAKGRQLDINVTNFSPGGETDLISLTHG